MTSTPKPPSRTIAELAEEYQQAMDYLHTIKPGGAFEAGFRAALAHEAVVGMRKALVRANEEIVALDYFVPDECETALAAFDKLRSTNE